MTLTEGQFLRAQALQAAVDAGDIYYKTLDELASKYGFGRTDGHAFDAMVEAVEGLVGSDAALQHLAWFEAQLESLP